MSTSNPYPHWGFCVVCDEKRDLNDELRCKECQKTYENGLSLVKVVKSYLNGSLFESDKDHPVKSLVDKLKLE